MRAAVSKGEHMRSYLIFAGLLAICSTQAFADTSITIAPSVDTWVASQSGPEVTYDGDIVVGTALPESMTFVDVPDSPDIAYVYVNKHRVLVEKKTHKVIKVYK
jgi:hypothetical protein